MITLAELLEELAKLLERIETVQKLEQDSDDLDEILALSLARVRISQVMAEIVEMAR